MNKIELIKESLKCRLCNSVLNQPVILPCLNTICQAHVIDYKPFKYKCLICKEEHDIPKQGFKENSLAKNIIESRIMEDRDKSSSELESEIGLFDLISEYEEKVFEFEKFRFEKFTEFNQKVEKTRNNLKSKIDNLMDCVKTNFGKCEYELVEKVNELSLNCNFIKADINEKITKNKNSVANQLDFFREEIESNIDKVNRIKNEYISMANSKQFNDVEQLFEPLDHYINGCIENIKNDSEKNLKDAMISKESRNIFADKYLITCVANKTINVWDMHANKSVYSGCDQKNPIKTIYLLSKHRLLTIAFHTILKLWDLKKENSFQVIKSYFGPITSSLNFGNDLVVIACKENLEIWDFRQETLMRNIDNAHKGDINCLVKMSDSCFVSGSNDGLVKIWNIESRREVGKVKLNEPVTNVQIKARRSD